MGPNLFDFTPIKIDKQNLHPLLLRNEKINNLV